MRPFRVMSRGASGGGGGTGLLMGLVSFWELEEASSANRVDAKSVNDLSVTGSPAGATSGLVGNAFPSGAGVYLKNPSPTSCDFLTGDYTIAAWVKTAATNLGVLCRWGNTTNQRQWALIVESGIAKNFWSLDGTAFSSADGSSVNDNAWHLLVAYRDTANNQQAICVDNGTPVTASLSSASSLYNGGYSLTLASLNTGGTYTDNALVDQVGIWSRKLSSTEIASFYNSGAGLAYSAF